MVIPPLPTKKKIKKNTETQTNRQQTDIATELADSLKMEILAKHIFPTKLNVFTTKKSLVFKI